MGKAVRTAEGRYPATVAFLGLDVRPKSFGAGVEVGRNNVYDVAMKCFATLSSLGLLQLLVLVPVFLLPCAPCSFMVAFLLSCAQALPLGLLVVVAVPPVLVPLILHPSFAL